MIQGQYEAPSPTQDGFGIHNDIDIGADGAWDNDDDTDEDGFVDVEEVAEARIGQIMEDSSDDEDGGAPLFAKFGEGEPRE
jgi:hypothetical protein